MLSSGWPEVAHGAVRRSSAGWYLEVPSVVNTRTVQNTGKRVTPYSRSAPCTIHMYKKVLWF